MATTLGPQSGSNWISALYPGSVIPDATAEKTAKPAAGGFFGWRILAVAVITSILTGPGQTIGVSVFIDPMVAALGISRSTVSSAYLIGTLTGASAMPMFGRFVDRRGVRTAQMLVGAAFAAALVNMAGVQNAIWLAVGFAGIRMMGQGALSMIPMVAVSLWFSRRRGVAMGIMATIGGAGIVTVPLILNALIDATSWRATWLIAAGFTLVTVVPLGRFGMIDRPSAVGQFPDGIPPDDGLADGQFLDGVPPDDGLADGASEVRGGTGPATTAAPAGTPRSFTRAEAIRTRQFWILATISTVSGMLVTGLNFHQIDLLGEAGLNSGQAAAMFLPQILGSSTMAIGVGFVLDRVGVRLVPAFGVFLLILVHILAALMQPGLVVFAYAVAMGATGGAIRAALSTMLPAYFGTDHIGAIQGVMTVTGVVGSALGPVTLALVEAQSGSYRSANLALLVLPLLAFAFTLTNRRPEPLR